MQPLGAIDADPDIDLLFGEERAPGVVDQRPVGLEGMRQAQFRRFQFVDQKSAINSGESAAAFFWIIARRDDAGRRRVFMNSLFTQVRNGDDDERLDQLLLDQSLRGFINAPLDSAKRSGCVENVLSIVQI